MVFMEPTRKPMARLKVPLFCWSASVPMATLKSPVVLLSSALEPTATLYWPVVSAVSALALTAVLLIPTPVLTSCSALMPGVAAGIAAIR